MKKKNIIQILMFCIVIILFINIVNAGTYNYDAVSNGVNWYSCNAYGYLTGLSNRGPLISNQNTLAIEDADDTVCFRYHGDSLFGACKWGPQGSLGNLFPSGRKFVTGQKVPLIDNFEDGVIRWDTMALSGAGGTIGSTTKSSNSLIYSSGSKSAKVVYRKISASFAKLNFSTSQIAVKNWTNYSALEFDIEYNISFPLKLQIKNSNTPIFDDYVKNSVVGIFNSSKLNHIKIPLGSITNANKNNINFINFYVNLNEINSESYPVYIDNMYLTGSKTKYCSGSGWISNFNDDSSGDTCNNAGFNWTGSECCGDAVETLAGDEDGCYNGEFIANNTGLIWLPLS